MIRNHKVLEFDGFSVDLDAAQLRSEGQPIKVEPQVFDLIGLLCANPGRLISYDEIIEKLWHGRCISNAAVATRINAARKALGDDGTTQRVIKTVRGRGLRFELEARSELADQPASGGYGPQTSATGGVILPADCADRALPDMPSIAVLSFANMSPDPDQDYFADGIVEDIITGLSRVAQFFVIARNSTFAYKGRSVDVRQIGRELGVRYVLQGSVRKSGEQVRIASQLIEAASGYQIWADRFDGCINDIFELQDQVTSSVIGAIQPSIRAAEVSRSRRKRPENLVAYDHYMQALPHVAALTREANAVGLDLLERALALEQEYPSALSMAAWCHAQRCVYGWTKVPETESRLAVELADRAVTAAGTDSFALSMLGAARTLVRDFEVAKDLLEQAVRLDPNCSWGWNRLGWLNGYLDNSAKSIDCFDRAIRLSPFDPMNFNCFVGIGAAHFMEGRDDEAIRWMERALSSHPDSRWIYRQLVPAYRRAGRMTEAANGLQCLLLEYPDLTCDGVRAAMLYSANVMRSICDGLAAAGIPKS